MKPAKSFLLGATIAGSLFFVSCNENKSTAKEDEAPKIKEENITYSDDTTTLNGFIVYDENKKGKQPAILVVHEWWGLNDYTKNRARQLASLGYVAMAVDIFGNGKTASNPQEAQQLIQPFVQDPQLTKRRLHAAVLKIKEFEQTDPTNIAAIGYCFGGAVVLNSAKLGEDVKGVVSFHGILAGPPANKDLLKANVLICHGEADQFVSPQEITKFKHEMDSIGANYEFKVYPGGKHAFTNPDATRLGQQFNIDIAYNAAADTASWKDMQNFLARVLKF